MSEPSPTTFQELIDQGFLEIGDGYRAKNSELDGDGLIFLRAGHVSDTHIDFDGVDRFSERDASTFGPKVAQIGDTIITTKGNSTGRTSFVTPDMPSFVYSPHLSYWRTKAPDKISSYYLRYWSRSKEFGNQLQGMARSTDMAPYLSLKDQRALRITLPPIETQDRVGEILCSLDDKIELNRRMNRTLEAMAQAIFKSWFVDFEPVKAKAAAKAAGATPAAIERAAIAGRSIEEAIVQEGYFDDLTPSNRASLAQTAALFPDACQASELDEIPEGWMVNSLGSICEPAIGGQWGSDSHEEGLVPSICLRGCDMADISADGFGPKSPVRYIKPNALEKRSTSPNDLLIAASGAGPCGRPLWCSPRQSSARYGHQVIYSNFVKRFTFQQPSHAVFAERLLMPKYRDGSISDYITGTSVPNLDANGLLSGFEFVMPSDDLISRFFGFFDLVDQQRTSDESRTLAQLRDTLLPKLLSGELTIPAAQAQTEEALT